MIESSANTARKLLERIRNTRMKGPFRVMNVCGGHERTITTAGIRAIMPGDIEIIPGPGCPICVCPEEDVLSAIHLSRSAHIVLLTFGDMLRVPVSGAKGAPRSLEQARAAGCNVKVIASPREAVKFAQEAPGREVVLFAVGFETTVAPIGGLIAEGLPKNLSILLSGRRTWPAVEMLLTSEQPGFDALIAPGHVTTVMGPEEWTPVPERFGIPAAVAGFEVDSLLAAIYSVLEQHRLRRPILENCYPGVVKPQGNPTARRILGALMDVVDANWRGIGVIPMSGFQLKEELQDIDSRYRFGISESGLGPRSGTMPPGCDCARVVLGKVYPYQCRLYGRACTPRRPIGPCMVSEEGACRIWWSSGAHRAKECEGGERRYE